MEEKKEMSGAWECISNRTLVRAELLYNQDLNKAELIVSYDFDTATSEIWSNAVNSLRYVRGDELLKQQIKELKDALEIWKVSSVCHAIESEGYEHIARQIENHVPEFMLETLIQGETKVDVSFIDYKAVAAPKYQNIRMTYKTTVLDGITELIWR
jgi:hypothetical protein